MDLKSKTYDIYTPSGIPLENVISKTTHMAIAAHQDDLEIMAYDGIIKCFQSHNHHFLGVVVTNGSGSARTNVYETYSDEEMIEVRKLEQRKAAMIGEYLGVVQLGYPSKDVKDRKNDQVIQDLITLLKEAKPDVVYTHNFADKHDTHIGVSSKVIHALRSLESHERPNKVYGCEVWRNLDWMIDSEKVVFDVSKHPNLSASLIGVFDSQIVGGKRYDLATEGRRMANATFFTSHEVDQGNQLSLAMDLTPLILDDHLDVTEYIKSYIERFKEDVCDKIKKYL